MNKTPSQISMAARNKLIYKSNFSHLGIPQQRTELKELNMNKTPSKFSVAGRNKIIYKSSFTLG